MNNIYFQDYNVNSRLPSKKILKNFLDGLFKKEKKAISRIDIIFCTDEFLLKLNQKFLSHNYYTDTMSFVLQENPVLGEIYISIERVKDNSSTLGIPYTTELFRVIIHSCLHLCGYTDSRKNTKDQITKLQEKYLRWFLVSRETQIGE